MANYTYLRREFLNPPETTYSSHVLVHVEDSENGTRAHGSNIVNIADCHRVTTFDFYLGNQQARDWSIAKINLLLEVLGEFRDELLNQAALISLRAAKQQANEEEGNDVG